MAEENKHRRANREERVVRWMFVLLLLWRDAGIAAEIGNVCGANRAAPRKHLNVTEDYSEISFTRLVTQSSINNRPETPVSLQFARFIRLLIRIIRPVSSSSDENWYLVTLTNVTRTADFCEYL